MHLLLKLSRLNLACVWMGTLHGNFMQALECHKVGD